jgi:hypothetical protein
MAFLKRAFFVAWKRWTTFRTPFFLICRNFYRKMTGFSSCITQKITDKNLSFETQKSILHWGNSRWVAASFQEKI